MKVRVKKLRSDAVLPKRAHSTDAGMDLTCTSRVIDWEMDPTVIEYGTGIAMEIPEGHVGLLFPRSSIAKHGQLMCNSVGVIDHLYFGEIKLKMKALDGAKLYEPGDRIGQLIIIPYPQIELEEVDDLGTSERGTGGFGSTGK